MKKLIILLDLDDVLENQNELWVQSLCDTYGSKTKYEDITDWNMSQFYPELSDHELFEPVLDDKLVSSMSVTRDSVRLTKEWHNRGHTIMVVTSTSTRNIDAKVNWLRHYYEWFTYSNLILTHKKQLIKGDIIVDDGVHNLLPDEETGIEPTYIKLCFDKPWNRNFDCESNGILRVHSFSEIDEVVKKLEGEYSDKNNR